MTNEELKQLKPGDEIFIRARYKKIYADGDVCFSISVTSVFGEVAKGEGHTLPENIIFSLPSPVNVIKNTETAPKYDTCRKFRKGDKVQPRIWRDRVPTARLGATRFIPEQRIYEVFSDELHEFVKLISGDEVIEMHVCFLELVTPVEELEPYYVKETASVYEVFNRNENNSSVAIFFKSQYSIEKAKERAEAERDRLNAEHRKEQNNG